METPDSGWGQIAPDVCEMAQLALDLSVIAVLIVDMQAVFGPRTLAGTEFEKVVRERYHEFTQPGLPDGPQDRRPHAFR